MKAAHLLDLITDVNFANLVGAAFQKEGEVMRGPVLFHDQPYEAAILCLRKANLNSSSDHRAGPTK